LEHFTPKAIVYFSSMSKNCQKFRTQSVLIVAVPIRIPADYQLALAAQSTSRAIENSANTLALHQISFK